MIDLKNSSETIKNEGENISCVIVGALPSVKNVIADPNFELGFMLKGLNSIKDGHNSIRDYKFADKNPVWYLCQWNSKFNLIGKDFCDYGGKREIGDESKLLRVDREELTFRLNASHEYSHPRAPEEGWPHLLIEQEIKENNRIKDMSALRLRGSFKLNGFADYMNGAAREYHTAQFVWVVVLQNDNPLSMDYKKIMWVVLGLYDSRYKYVPLYCAQDNALPDGDFIYSFGGLDFLPQSLHDGAQVDIDFDIFPRISEMLRVAKHNGYLTNTQEDDLVLASTNMGFEVPGTYDIEIKAKNLAILAQGK